MADQLVSYAVLEAPDSILGAAARRALIQLVKTLPTKRDAMAYLQLQLNRALRGDLMLPVDEFSRVTLWTYDEKQALVAPTTHDARVVALVLATRISTNLYSLDLSNAQYKRQFLRSVLASSKVLNGISQPLAGGTLQLVSQESPAYVLALLEHCLKEENYPAAVGAAEVLGAIHFSHLFESRDNCSNSSAKDLRLLFSSVSTSAFVSATPNSGATFAACIPISG